MKSPSDKGGAYGVLWVRCSLRCVEVSEELVFEKWLLGLTKRSELKGGLDHATPTGVGKT